MEDSERDINRSRMAYHISDVKVVCLHLEELVELVFDSISYV